MGKKKYVLMDSTLDEILRVKEERDYLSRIESHPETYSKAGFDKKLHRFGTLTMVHKIENQKDGIKKTSKNKKKAEIEKVLEQIVFESYKQRDEIEVMFDSYKNYLDADVSYM